MRAVATIQEIILRLSPFHGDEFTCRIIICAKQLVSIQVCYLTGDWFNTPLSSFDR